MDLPWIKVCGRDRGQPGARSKSIQEPLSHSFSMEGGIVAKIAPEMKDDTENAEVKVEKKVAVGRYAAN